MSTKKARVKDEEQQPPWVAFPGYDTASIFWRQEGEPWAQHVWLPFWSSLSEDERKRYLKEWEAPQEWCDFYDEEQQKNFGELDGVAGWILRNNLVPCRDDKPRYISVQEVQDDDSFWGRFISEKKWFVLQVLVLGALFFLLKFYQFI